MSILIFNKEKSSLTLKNNCFSTKCSSLAMETRRRRRKRQTVNNTGPDDQGDAGNGPPSPPQRRRVQEVIPVAVQREEDDVCSVCLDPPVHPVALPCKHVFCFLCVKGLVHSEDTNSECTLCRWELGCICLVNDAF